jgi:hypothetical protein
MAVRSKKATATPAGRSALTEPGPPDAGHRARARRIAVFISHSSHDNAIAGELRARLEAQGFPAPFLDYHPENGIPAGHNWEHEIYRQLKRCSAVVYLGSKNSAQSKWCFAELALARSLDKPIFPLRIEGEARISSRTRKRLTGACSAA